MPAAAANPRAGRRSHNERSRSLFRALRLRAVQMPGKCGANDRVEIRDLGMPAEQLGGKTRVGDQYRRIAGPSCGFPARDGFAADLLGGPDHLAHRVTTAGAEVERHALPPGPEMFERTQMRFGEILDMNVVADRRTVGRRIIGTINVDLPPLSERRLQNARDQMRLGLVAFADLTPGIGAGGVEIAQ